MKNAPSKNTGGADSLPRRHRGLAMVCPQQESRRRLKRTPPPALGGHHMPELVLSLV